MIREWLLWIVSVRRIHQPNDILYFQIGWNDRLGHRPPTTIGHVLRAMYRAQEIWEFHEYLKKCKCKVTSAYYELHCFIMVFIALLLLLYWTSCLLFIIDHLRIPPSAIVQLQGNARIHKYYAAGNLLG